jgi:hypothetical protein
MQYAKDLGSSWREETSAKLKSMGYYPIDIATLDKAYTEKYGHLYLFLNDGELLQRKSNIRKQIIYTDIQLVINDSDALIILYDESVRRGAGTISECQTAYNRDIPLFLVNTYKTLDEVPGWLQALTTKMFDTFDDLYAYLEKLPSGILKRDAYGNHHTGTHYLCSLCGDPFEKGKTHFVSKVSPLYCKPCVEVVKNTYEAHADRYDFFVKYLEAEASKELTDEEPNPNIGEIKYIAIEQARELAKRQLAFLKED